MQDGLLSENSFIVDRNWQNINPDNQLKISTSKAKEFIYLLYKDHQDIRHPNTPPLTQQQLLPKIHSFILKYIQQKELSTLKKGEIPFVREAQYLLDLRDCLEIWRWLNEDLTSRTRPEFPEDDPHFNEFQMESRMELSEIKRPQPSSKSKRFFGQLSLQQQQSVMIKSLQMVHMYKPQLRIIFKHYCRFAIQNEHNKITTFDDVSFTLEVMTVNRFMLFCRDFDIIKIVEFKRKTEHNNKISKQLLLAIFKKTAQLQKYLNFEAFMMTLVSISLKIHENVDPRSLIHIELLLNALHIRSYNEFTTKLESLSIKYSPSDFYNCYKDIFKKALQKKQMSVDKINPLNRHRFVESDTTSPRNYDSKKESLQHHEFVQLIEQKRLSYQNTAFTAGKSSKTKSQQLQKRKSSLPVLPSINNNRFFKPIQHNHHKNNYKTYLGEVEDTSSVFKNRITGYSNINALKNQQKPFHMTDNPETISKDTLSDLISESKNKIQSRQISNQNQVPINQSLTYSDMTSKQQIINQLSNNSSKHQKQPEAIEKMSDLDEKRSTRRDQVTTPIVHTEMPVRASQLDEMKPLQEIQKRKVLKELGKKVDLKDNDELLKKHMAAQLKSKTTRQKVGISQQ